MVFIFNDLKFTLHVISKKVEYYCLKDTSYIQKLHGCFVSLQLLPSLETVSKFLFYLTNRAEAWNEKY